MINSSVIYPTKRINLIGCAVLFVLLVALAMNAAAQGTGTISGRLMVGEKPAGGFTVFVVQDSNSSRQNAPVARGVADSEGRYQLTGLAAGKYRVRASAPGYVVESGSEYNFIIGKAVDLRDGETVENIDLKLTRGAVITGKITAPDGKPLIGTRLTVKSLNARGQYQNYFSMEAPFQMMQTDDRGVYRLYGLPAGKYLISAGAEANRGVSAFDGGMNYPLTYYPNVTNEAEAKLLELTAGDTKRDIDIRLATAETAKGYRALVKVIDSETGKPMPNAQVACFSVKNNFAGGTFRPIPTNEKGEAIFEGLVNGRYIVDLTNVGMRTGDELYKDYTSKPAIFEITDGDNEDLVINAKRGLSISGYIKFDEEPNPAVLAQLRQLSVLAYNVRERNQPTVPRQNASGKIGFDLSFRVSGLAPGKAGVLLQNNQLGFGLARIEQNGVPLRNYPELLEGKNLTDLALVVFYGKGVIRGEVKVVGGALPPGTQMRVMAGRMDANIFSSSVSTSPDARGSFVLERLSSGEHRVTLIFSPPPDAAANPEARKSLPRPLTQTVFVPTTGEAQMTFTLNLTPKENKQ